MYIKRIKINNIKCLKNVNIDLQRPDGTYAGFTVLAGRNGSGKSTLLRSIALSIAGLRIDHSLQKSYTNWITSGKKESQVETELVIDKIDKFDKPEYYKNKNSLKVGLRWLSSEEKKEPRVSSLEFPDEQTKNIDEWLFDGPWSENLMGWFIAGYGPFRYLPSNALDTFKRDESILRINQLISLFQENLPLSDGMSWLREIYLLRLENKPGFIDIEKGILALLNDGLLPEGMNVIKFDSDGLWVSIDGKELPLRELSDGFRTVVALIVDLSRQLYEAYGEFNVSKVNDHCEVLYPGVVLIDELDAHLHISWQQKIGFWLKSRFPKLQFIVTTHSPFICQAADPKGLIRLPAPGESRSVEHVPDDLFKAVTNGSADEAVVTEFFGLEHPHSHLSEQLQEELAELEVRVIEGIATPDQENDYHKLRAKLPNTQKQLVEQALRKLQKLS